LCDQPQLWPNLKELNLGESMTNHSDLKELPRIASKMKKLETMELKVARSPSLPFAKEKQVADEITADCLLLPLPKVLKLSFYNYRSEQLNGLSVCLYNKPHA